MSSEAAAVYGGMNLEATTPADVRRAVLTARARGLRVAVRATGHGTFFEPAARHAADRHLGMRSVLVDPERATARVGPGATWGDVISAAAPFGLAPVSGTNLTVGVTGFTFGGGHGFLARKHGLGADNLLRADLVTADGELLTAPEERRRGLFWALAAPAGTSASPPRSRSAAPGAQSSAASPPSTAGSPRTCSRASPSTRSPTR